MASTPRCSRCTAWSPDTDGFADRAEAGRLLAAALPPLDDPVVLGLPRGGVPVAAAVAETLNAPLDVLVVRKLGLPVQPELAMGAIASGGVRVLNEDVLREAHVPPDVLDAVAGRETQALEQRERLYRRGRAPVELANRDVVIVDDGLATGASVRVAVLAARAAVPRRIVVGVPVAARETLRALRRDGIEIAAVLVPEPFVAVGTWYRDFAAVADDEVVRLLAASR